MKLSTVWPQRMTCSQTQGRKIHLWDLSTWIHTNPASKIQEDRKHTRTLYIICIHPKMRKSGKKPHNQNVMHIRKYVPPSCCRCLWFHLAKSCCHDSMHRDLEPSLWLHLCLASGSNIFSLWKVAAWIGLNMFKSICSHLQPLNLSSRVQLLHIQSLWSLWCPCTAMCWLSMVTYW